MLVHLWTVFIGNVNIDISNFYTVFITEARKYQAPANGVNIDNIGGKSCS